MLHDISHPSNDRNIIVHAMDRWDPLSLALHPMAGEPLEEIPLNPKQLDHTVEIGSALTQERKNGLYCKKVMPVWI